ncbi:MAG: SH3 domain-containing protein [Phaeovulum sp.]|uniref:SH3 domain-containing protein n=1 Tax=Phaeovulum sp. TaxID=2934796 RepID=UPI00272F8F18|nr:SH3 domain-containing protein [Phaeovulum sp.]MDP2063051.1 SH3 domain-containing protein [Phaeovulum sp.]
MKILRALKAFSTALAALAISAVSAAAVEAVATTWLNVRSGPGGGFGVVTTLAPNTVVNVSECQDNGWCYVEHAGPSGWVSSTYLAAPAAGGGGASADPNCKLSLTLGPSGPTLSLVCGDGSVTVPLPGTPPPPPPPPPVGDQACFYQDPNYGGQEFCYGTGTLNSLNATFNNKISSVKLFGAARARLCDNTNLGGPCFAVTSDTALLTAAINDKASSLAVHTGIWLDVVPLPLPPVLPLLPVTHSTGAIDLHQTFSANLDNGSIGSAGADIWYQAVTAAEKYITPRNGAQLALGDGSNRGYAGCRVASFSGAQISLNSIPVGTYVCVKTSEGRTSQFRLNGYVGTTMKLGYTTWTN